jgi:hypothetical protein
MLNSRDVENREPALNNDLRSTRGPHSSSKKGKVARVVEINCSDNPLLDGVKNSNDLENGGAYPFNSCNNLLCKRRPLTPLIELMDPQICKRQQSQSFNRTKIC